MQCKNCGSFLNSDEKVCHICGCSINSDGNSVEKNDNVLNDIFSRVDSDSLQNEEIFSEQKEVKDKSELFNNDIFNHVDNDGMNGETISSEIFQNDKRNELNLTANDIDSLEVIDRGKEKGKISFLSIIIIIMIVVGIVLLFFVINRVPKLSGENYKRSEMCRKAIKEAYQQYVSSDSNATLIDGTCIIVTTSRMNINFKIVSDEEKIVGYSDNHYYVNSISNGDYKSAILYSEEDMEAYQNNTLNGNVMNSFYFDGDEILK